jgi:hypothetical protein
MHLLDKFLITNQFLIISHPPKIKIHALNIPSFLYSWGLCLAVILYVSMDLKLSS